MEPVMDALTTPVKPFDNANSAMISSAALPNVAFRSPPIPCPRWVARCSVARPIHPASGIMARHEQMNRAVGLSSAGMKRKAKAMGTNTKSQFSDGFSNERSEAPAEGFDMTHIYHIFSHWRAITIAKPEFDGGFRPSIRMLENVTPPNDSSNAQLRPLFVNVSHTSLHYGNLITEIVLDCQWQRECLR